MPDLVPNLETEKTNDADASIEKIYKTRQLIKFTDSQRFNAQWKRLKKYRHLNRLRISTTGDAITEILEKYLPKGEWD